jgi:branched-chain amino acid transport system substrate-binding protein
LQGFLIQATARGLHERAQLVLAAGDHVIPQLGNKMPDGIFLGARGVNGLAANARGGELKELTDTMWSAYEAEYDTFPVQAPFRMWQAIFGLKTAVEKAMADNGGTKPTDEQLAAAMTGLAWDAPSGRIEMALAGGHQAIQPNAIGTTKWNTETGKMELVDVEYYNARCVNPPEGMKSADWLAQGFPGAQCD